MECRCPIAKQVSKYGLTQLGEVFHCPKHGNYVWWGYRNHGGWRMEIPLASRNPSNGSWLMDERTAMAGGDGHLVTPPIEILEAVAVWDEEHKSA